jgi:hypothetical protein
MYLNDAYNFQQFILIFLSGAQLHSQIAISHHTAMTVLLISFCYNTLFIFICAEYNNSEILIWNNITCFFVHYTLLPDYDSVQAETCSGWFPVTNIQSVVFDGF